MQTTVSPPMDQHGGLQHRHGVQAEPVTSGINAANQNLRKV